MWSNGCASGRFLRCGRVRLTIGIGGYAVAGTTSAQQASIHNPRGASSEAGSATMPITVRQTRADKEIAGIIARNTTPTTEETAEILTWGADEHVLCAVAAVCWLYCRGRPAPERAASNHILITTIAATILPHPMKHVFTQERPTGLLSAGETIAKAQHSFDNVAAAKLCRPNASPAIGPVSRSANRSRGTILRRNRCFGAT
jgi:hypothetical protein